MTIDELVREYLSMRAPGWVVLSDEESLLCGLEAVRFYAAYGTIASVDLHDTLQEAPGAGGTLPAPPDEVVVLDALPIKNLSLIDLTTELTVGEWALIRRLFTLYLERENAMRLEASRAMGLEFYGRQASEISQDITTEERELPARTFVHVLIEV